MFAVFPIVRRQLSRASAGSNFKPDVDDMRCSEQQTPKPTPSPAPKRETNKVDLKLSDPNAIRHGGLGECAVKSRGGQEFRLPRSGSCKAVGAR